MLQETRLHRIRTLLTTQHQVSTERIVKELGISRETARRDIIELEALGLARRVHGGVVAVQSQPEPPLQIRRSAQAKEKRAIAAAAVPHLHSGQTLFLDAGTTTTMLAEELRTMSGLTIITNSLQAALALSAGEESDTLNNQVILIGGMMLAGAQQTRGEITVAEIYRYRADVALLSPVGIEARYGASSFHPHEAAIAGAMIQQSRMTILLADHSKLGVISRTIYAPVSDVDMLICDRGAAKAGSLAALKAVIPQVLVI
ncbi:MULTISPECIES: DeoR/GlpR family DNA-binding transcription regulator [Enterobacterales]|uniref:DeoR/GlpR family DNA-binding transcription regulator n=1 Tax=Enterobacterales TaxID=91347 RepID=UPI0007CD08C1|nr:MULTISPECIES: DeoR/GlpR family DNA-binding transcription regulator [Enterobacterales]SAQ15152.1 glycerol-3-phosphate regulon repressor [Klebsiella oxytoca]HBX4001159.1 DeoR/GlpR transcriptional regulator [Klebsiella variicola]MBZ6858839.1 DeoR/GlpR transcriptional regulator [Klebsiella michiganensis]MBZ7423212.1 DeoR/GlpR transcriptional regulator [Klebsiella michiganensis]MDU4137356.1 DeoR/GlpR family DNA-binding transcription regulator [Klebsiella michiganensis]